MIYFLQSSSNFGISVFSAGLLFSTNLGTAGLTVLLTSSWGWARPCPMASNCYFLSKSVIKDSPPLGLLVLTSSLNWEYWD